MFGSWGVGVVLYVGSHVSHFIGKLLPVGSLAYGALVLGTCPPLAAEIVEQS